MLHIRPISPQDDQAIAAVIRTAMGAFDVDPSTTILGDPTLSYMYQTYQQEKAVYFIALWNDKIVGGCGIRQLDGTDENICELQRMFLLPEARGKGIGKALMKHCLQKAEAFRYDKVYIETLSQMHEARNLYQQFGFVVIPQALGNTGHCGCDVKMMKVL